VTSTNNKHTRNQPEEVQYATQGLTVGVSLWAGCMLMPSVRQADLKVADM